MKNMKWHIFSPLLRFAKLLAKKIKTYDYKNPSFYKKLVIIATLIFIFGTIYYKTQPVDYHSNEVTEESSLKETEMVEQEKIKTTKNKTPVTYSHNDVLKIIKSNEVLTMSLTANGQVWEILGTTIGGDRFKSTVPNTEEFTNLLVAYDVTTTYETENNTNFGRAVLYGLLIIFVVYYIFKSRKTSRAKQTDHRTEMLKSKAVLQDEGKSKVLFTDVAGNEEEKEELTEVVDFLKNKDKYVEIGARIPKGVMLVGPPGTGKTLLAKAVAGEAGVPFFSISGSDFVEMFVGVGAARVRDMFKQAKEKAPCIIFIDEIDAVGKQRSSGLNGSPEQEQTLNQLLVEMDGFGTETGIVLIAATNRIDILDKALLRSGRFDRQVYIGLPDVTGREAILKVHARNKKVKDCVDFRKISERTTGFSGADLENLLNEAAILGIRTNQKVIRMEEIEQSIDKILAGTQKKNKKVSKRERRLIAYHESGHVIMGHFLNTQDVHKVTIIPRGQAGGYAVMMPKEEKMTATERELKNQIAGLLGGRAAEEFFLKEVSTGASNDFMKATDLARKMVTEYGMSSVGLAQFKHEQGSDYSSETKHKIEEEVNKIIKEQYDICLTYMNTHKKEIERLVKTLLKKETLNRDEILTIIDEKALNNETEIGDPFEA